MTGNQLTEDQKNQVRYWIGLGCDLVASDTRIKQPIEKWSENTIGEPDYESRLENGFLNQWGKMVNYDDGVAVICGQLRHGHYKDKWLSCFNFDTKEALDKFCDLFGTSLELLAQKTLVEWHGSLEKIHVFFITNSPLKDVAVEGFEIKATNKRLAFKSFFT
jgi:hypothetical protein